MTLYIYIIMILDSEYMWRSLIYFYFDQLVRKFGSEFPVFSIFSKLLSICVSISLQNVYMYI